MTARAPHPAFRAPAATACPRPASLGEAIGEVGRLLAEAGIPAARLEARMLVEAATGLSREAIFAHPERRLSAPECRRLDALVARRRRREPAAYVTGRREFWGLPFRVAPAVLVPRPESETLIEAALEALGDGAPGRAILDLGTGSGCLLIALLRELRGAWGVGVDASPEALALARENAAALGVAGRARFIAGHWGTALDQRFDLVLANPPYLASAEIGRLAPELGFEPRLALDGGADGLAAYREIALSLRRLVAPGGRALIEVAAGQAGAVAEIFAARGLGPVARRRDLAGHERCLVVAPPPPSVRRAGARQLFVNKLTGTLKNTCNVGDPRYGLRGLCDGDITARQRASFRLLMPSRPLYRPATLRTGGCA